MVLQASSVCRDNSLGSAAGRGSALGNEVLLPAPCLAQCLAFCFFASVFGSAFVFGCATAFGSTTAFVSETDIYIYIYQYKYINMNIYSHT